MQSFSRYTVDGNIKQSYICAAMGLLQVLEILWKSSSLIRTTEIKFLSAYISTEIISSCTLQMIVIK